MALTASDYRLRLRLGFAPDGSFMYNTFYYKRSAGVGTASSLVTSFVDDHLPAIANILSDVMLGAYIEAENLLNPDDFAFSNQTGFAGQRTTTEFLPKYLTASFLVQRGSRVQRHPGRKAFGVIAEDDVLDGQPTSGYLTVLTATATTLSATAVTGTNSWRIAVPYSIKDTDSMSPDFGKYVLDSLYTSPGVAFQRISTQNTRKDW